MMAEWKLTASGLEHADPNYFIEGGRLAELRRVNGRILAAWPLQLAEKSWCDMEDFIRQFVVAIERFKPTGWEAMDIEETIRVARQTSLNRRS